MENFNVALPVLIIVSERMEEKLKEKYGKEMGITKIKPFGTIESILRKTSGWYVEISAETLKKLLEIREFAFSNGATFTLMSNEPILK